MIEADPIELRYVEHGAGPAVVLLHGFPLDRSMWDDQVTPLAERFRVIVPDLRGHGESAAPEGPYTMAQHVADVQALLDRLGLERAALVGLSMGGYVTLNFLARYSERVSAAALVDTRAPADSEETRAARAQHAELVRSEGLEPFVELQTPRMFAPATLREHPELVRRYAEIVRRARPAAVVAALAGLASRPDVTSTLAQIGCPTLVVVGAEDVLTPPVDARMMAERIPGARLEIIEGAGHLSNMEAPERFNTILAGFLTDALGNGAHAAGNRLQ